MMQVSNHQSVRCLVSSVLCAGAVLAALSVERAAGQLPGTDIWLAPLDVAGEGVTVGPGRNVTARPGYDNQPCFLAGGGFLFSSGDTTGTDVFVWDAAHGIRPVTRTPESEYSPTLLPAGSAGFCAVRVEADGAQRLWRFDMDGGKARLVMADVDSVGYFEWVDDHTLALFVVGEPHTLRIVDVPSQKETVVARDIGRFIRRVPGTRDVAYTLHQPDDTFRFMVLAAGTNQSKPLIGGAGGQDAVWADDWLIATAGTEIFAVRPAAGGDWTRVADVTAWGAAGPTRLAVSADQGTLAVVCAE